MAQGTLFGLQESQNLKNVERIRKFGFKIVSSACRSAAIIYAREWQARTIQSFEQFDGFCAVLFHFHSLVICVVSAYFPHSMVDDVIPKYSELKQNISDFISDCTHNTKYEHVRRKFKVCPIVLADANAELDPWLVSQPARQHGAGEQAGGRLPDYVTGGGLVCRRRGEESSDRRWGKIRQEMADIFAELLQEFALSAANTFQDRCVTWESYKEEDRERRVLDYVCIPKGWVRKSTDVSFYWPGMERSGAAKHRLSDHALVRVSCAGVGDLHLGRDCFARSAPSCNLRGYRPDGIRDEKQIGAEMDIHTERLENNNTSNIPPDRLSDIVLAACTSPGACYTTYKQQIVPPARPPGYNEALDAVKELKDVGGPQLKEAKRKLNQLRKSYKRSRLEWELRPSRRANTHTTDKMKINGTLTQCRSTWAQGLEETATEKLSSTQVRAENVEIVRQLKVAAEAEPRTAMIDLPLVLKARARLKAGRAVGPDGVSAESLKYIPWSSMRRVASSFQSIFEGEEPTPDTWRNVRVTVQGKCKDFETFDETRFLVIQNLLSKWYSCCVTILLEQWLEHSGLFRDVGMYGFMEDRRTWEITAPLLHMTRHAATWGGDRTMYLASSDIKQAFDHTSISVVRRAMDEVGVPAFLQYAVLEPLCGCISHLVFQDVEVQNVCWDRSIRTGGPEGPLCFNIVVLAMWGPVMRSWKQHGMGYEVVHAHRWCDEDQNIRHEYPHRKHTVSHMLWADNIYVLSRSKEEMIRMMTQLTERLHEYGMTWKPNSLAYMAVGIPHSTHHEAFSIKIKLENHPGVTVYVFPRVMEMQILGTLVSDNYRRDFHADVKHRINIARANFFSEAGFYKSRAIGTKRKLQRYVEKVQSVLVYGLEGCVIDDKTVHDISATEGRFLRMMIHVPPLKDRPETKDEYERRRWKDARDRFCSLGFPSAVQITMYNQWLLAKDLVRYSQLTSYQRSLCQTAWVDCRQAMFSLTSTWESERDLNIATQKYLRKSRHVTGKRVCRGTRARGARGWHRSLELFFGDEWWLFYDGSYRQFLQYAESTCGQRIFNCFYLKWKADPMYVRGQEEEKMEAGDRELTEKQKEKLAKRMAFINENEVLWDEESPGIGLDIQGDSKLIVSWVNGRWRCTNRKYQKRVDQIVSTLCRLGDCMNIRPSSLGSNLVRHQYREANCRADSLTHLAREGRHHQKYVADYEPLYQYERDVYQSFCIRSAFDGGVSCKGCGCGYWIDVGFRLRPEFCVDVSPHLRPVIFKTVRECCWLIPDDSTVTETELYACEALVEGVSDICDKYFNEYFQPMHF